MSAAIVSNTLLIASSVFSTCLVGEVVSQTTGTSIRARFPINPCEFSKSDYTFGLTACVWRELPKSMTSRYSNRFKKLVGLDDDGVFNLLCKSIGQKGDILVEAFAREYSEEKEQNLFLETVLKCHDEALADGVVTPTKQSEKTQSAARSSTQLKTAAHHARNFGKSSFRL